MGHQKRLQISANVEEKQTLLLIMARGGHEEAHFNPV